MNRNQIVKQVNKKISGLAKGLFTDEYWQGVNIITDALEEMNLDFTLYHNTYIHADDGTPIGKRWYYESLVTKKPILVVIIASGAGTVKDPLSKYDIISYAS